MLEMIKGLKVEDRGFWLERLTTKELRGACKELGVKIYSKEYKGYKKADWINLICNLLEEEIFEQIKEAQTNEEAIEQLGAGDTIKDFGARKFYYDLIVNLHEEDRGIKEMTSIYCKYTNEEITKYSKLLLRHFHSDTGVDCGARPFEIIHNLFASHKEKTKQRNEELDELLQELREDGFTEEEIQAFLNGEELDWSGKFNVAPCNEVSGLIA